jgi:hypothetical protein
MNDDLLKKLLAGLPQQNELVDQVGNAPAYEVAPNLDPSIYPSPMAYPERKPTLDFTNEQPDVIQGSVPKPTIKPSLPFTNKQEPLPQVTEEVPTEKKMSFVDFLANMNNVTKDDELAKAQAGSNDIIRNILMARAANKIGASIAGVNADEKYGQDFVDLANKDVTDLQARRKSEMEQEDQGFKRKNQVISEQKALFELGDKEKENDPNSDVSKAFREYAKSYVEGTGLKIDDRLSMADLQKQMGVIGQKVQMKMSQDMRREQLALAGEQRAEATSEKRKEKGLLYGDKIAKQLEPIFDRKDKAERVKKSIQEAIKNPSGFRDIQTIYDFVKNMDPESAVREGEISLAQSTLPMWKKFELDLKGQAQGDVKKLTPELRSTLAKIADEVVQGINVTLNSKINRQRQVADQLGIDEKYWNRTYVPPELKAVQGEAASNSDDPRIDSFMKKNGIKDRNEAVKILKKEGLI